MTVGSRRVVSAVDRRMMAFWLRCRRRCRPCFFGCVGGSRHCWRPTQCDNVADHDRDGDEHDHDNNNNKHSIWCLNDEACMQVCVGVSLWLRAVICKLARVDDLRGSTTVDLPKSTTTTHNHNTPPHLCIPPRLGAAAQPTLHVIVE